MVFLRIFLLLYFSAFYLFVSCLGKINSRNAEIIYKYTEKCPKQFAKPEWDYTIKTSKLSRTKTQVTFTLFAKEDFNDSLKAAVFVAVWTNGGWKPNFFHFVVNNLCTTIKTKMKKAMHRMATDSNFTAGCPIPKGQLRLSNFLVDTKDYGSYPVVPYSKLRVTTLISKGNRKLICTHTYVELE